VILAAASLPRFILPDYLAFHFGRRLRCNELVSLLDDFGDSSAQA